MIGKEILNYIIVSKIGDGGMGTVYLAEHKFIQQQKVAIKVIRKDMVNESSRRRLQEEAEHLAGLNHPNIVKFLNYHIDNEGNYRKLEKYNPLLFCMNDSEFAHDCDREKAAAFLEKRFPQKSQFEK